MDDPRQILRCLHDAALAAAEPGRATAAALPALPPGRTFVAAIGKAAYPMARAVEQNWDGELTGLAVVPEGYGGTLDRIELIHAGHPLPDERSVTAARRLLAEADSLGPEDLLLALVSGGGSALAAVPAPGVTLAKKQAATKALLASGAAIGEINAVRRELSALKGGKLAERAAPAQVVTLIVSDVVGDDPADVASGPTVPGDSSTVVLNAGMALDGAAAAARSLGLHVIDLGDRVAGEATEVAAEQAALALVVQSDAVIPKPAVILSGGEVTVTGAAENGEPGGPNSEFALGLAISLGGSDGIYGLLADTDGIDGTGPHAGAFAGPGTLARGGDRGLDPAAALANHASAAYLKKTGDLLTTGPSRTNVNDFRAILILR